ncbi:hypothetical protein ACI3PL_23985, partial [Lacticaseibacillus paracasei]
GNMARNESMMGYIAKAWYGGAFVPARHMPQAAPRMPLGASYEGSDPARGGGSGGRTVNVYARTDANPRAIGHAVDRSLAFGGRIS